MSFTEITGSAYTELLEKRLAGEAPELTWLGQFRDILRPQLRQGVSLLDVGCATGYACRAFEAFGISYTGVEFEPAYLEIARQWFAGADGVEFIEHDIVEAPPPKTADIVIASAMLEHLPSLMPALKHLADGARKTLLLRTFLGESEQIHSIPSPVAEYRTTHRKFNNRYSFPTVLGYLESRGLQTRVVRDRYTDSAPQWVDSVVRTFYVVEAQRSGGGQSANGSGDDLPREARQ